MYIYCLILLPDTDKRSSISSSIQRLSSYYFLLFWGDRQVEEVSTGRELWILRLFSLFTYNFSKKSKWVIQLM